MIASWLRRWVPWIALCFLGGYIWGCAVGKQKIAEKAESTSAVELGIELGQQMERVSRSLERLQGPSPFTLGRRWAGANLRRDQAGINRVMQEIQQLPQEDQATAMVAGMAFLADQTVSEVERQSPEYQETMRQILEWERQDLEARKTARKMRQNKAAR